MEEEEDYKWINARSLNMPNMVERQPPKIDQEVSKIVGRAVYVNDPKLVRLVNEWRKHSDPDKPDNFLHHEDKRKQLKELFK